MKQTLFLVWLCFIANLAFSQNIPLPEHPRPDFERKEWLNLNGNWAFEFDKDNKGLTENWQNGNKKFSKTIHVPFPWGSALSGVKDSADFAWYQRAIQIPKEWVGKRIFVVIGASDYETSIWLNGQLLGKHEGGYLPFEFELTKNIADSQTQNLVIRVDDKRRDFALYGKQGYGNARGIWQTVYLEARPDNFLETIYFTPDIDKNKVTVVAALQSPATQDLGLDLKIANVQNNQNQVIKKGQKEITFEVVIPNAKLWTLDNPFLYEVKVSVFPPPLSTPLVRGVDAISTYFGMRKIGVMNLPNTNYPYVSLNNQPIYLQLALDQSYHPEGFYTFPSDEFMKNEIRMAKDIGLNGIRTHIKIDIPRKLYWADKLGLLVMSDLPNFWGEPTPEARQESERTLPELIKRDFNHPSIFSWILFNETWGLRTKVEENGKKVERYLPETQKWVAQMYHKAKALDPTRLVEDNSICCGVGHTETDISSWHEYQPGYGWENHLKNISENTYEGSTHHFEKGYKQGRQPNINSEFGNVWGYQGSMGDVDWSWDYHRAMNVFRKYPKIAGWLYTEHHDVINEWNGYWKFDRSPKFTGFGEIHNKMTLKDLHSEFYVSTGQEISKSVRPNEVVAVPLFVSCMSGRTDLGNSLILQIETHIIDVLGEKRKGIDIEQKVDYRPYMQRELLPNFLIMPYYKSIVYAKYTLMDKNRNILHRNFSTYIVETPMPNFYKSENRGEMELISIEPKQFSDAKWSNKQWNVLDGLKVNGAGSGYFEYKLPFPKNLDSSAIDQITFHAEVSSKPLLGKDRDNATTMDGDYMLGRGTFDPSRNPKAYPITDEKQNPTDLKITFNGVDGIKLTIPDDPADSKGVLSWHYQPEKGKLYEAGTYGYRLVVKIPKEAIKKAAKTGEFIIRLEVEGGGGLSIYSDKFGQYPFNPFLRVVRVGC